MYFLIDLAPTDLENPLAQLNHTFPTRDSVWELVRTIDFSLKENALKEFVLSKVFDTYWTQFERDFKEIIDSTPETEVVNRRKDNDIMLDVLSTVRMLDKRLRTIETNSERSTTFTDKESVRKEGISTNELRMYLFKFMEQELAVEIIIESLSEKFSLPRGMVRRELDRLKNTKEGLEKK